MLFYNFEFFDAVKFQYQFLGFSITFGRPIFGRAFFSLNLQKMRYLDLASAWKKLYIKKIYIS